MMKHIFTLLGCATLITAGIFLFVYGGYDDSPGAQLLGTVVVAFGAFCLYRLTKAQ